MLLKTKGIILHSLPYGERQTIINAYTEEFGRVAYIIYGTHAKRSKLSYALLTPLSIFNLEVEHFNTHDLQRIHEAKREFVPTQIQYHPFKNAIALFLAEMLYRILQEAGPNRPLFDFLCRSIHWLDVAEAGIANFHLAFLMQLSTFLGIHPDATSYRPDRLFDLQEGVFTDTSPNHTNCLDRTESAAFNSLLRISYENMGLYTFTRNERTAIIRHIIDYYRLHLFDFPEIRSLAVMQEIFN